LIGENRFIQRCGGALMAGAVVTILVNSLLTPLLFDRPGAVVAETTTAYLVRQSCSALAALLLVFGSLGIHLAQRRVARSFGAVGFLVCFSGGCLLFAAEWADVFVLRPLARIHPAAFAALDKNLFSSIGFGSAAVLFTLGWVLLCASVWRSAYLPKAGAIWTLSGLVAIPVLGATPWKTLGVVLGNVIFGAGLFTLGRGVSRLDPPKSKEA
jgi:hypothetical protein